MRPPPRLTVAVPTCNGEAHLDEALDGLLSQGSAEFDLLFCDDRSDDATTDRIRARVGDRARIEVNPERLGLAGNWNRCITLSRTPWVAVFHQDDVLRPGTLERRLAAVRQAPQDAGLIAERADVIDERGGIVLPSVVEYGGLADVAERPFVSFPPGAFSPRLETSNILRCSAVTTHRDAHQAVGGFDAGYRYVVDWDFWLRVADRFSVVWIEGEPRTSVRWHSASETHRFKKGLADLDEAERLLAGRRIRPGRRLARAYLNRAHDALKAGRTDLARTALGKALRTSPTALGMILGDPRLTAQMTALAVSPSLAGRWFAEAPAPPAVPAP